MNSSFWFFSGDEGLGYKYSHTVNETQLLINLIRTHPNMEMTMPILDYYQETLNKIFKHLNVIIAEKEYFISFPNSKYTISIKNIVQSFEKSSSWLRSTPIDIFSCLLNETAILNNANMLPDQNKEWFQENLYFKGINIICSVQKDADPCHTVSLGLLHHFQKKLNTNKHQKSFLENYFGTCSYRECKNIYIIPVNIEETHWAGIKLDFSERKVKHYDGIGQNAKSILYVILAFMIVL